MDLSAVLPLAGLFVGGALVGIVTASRSKMTKQVAEIRSQVAGVVVPLETIAEDVSDLKTDVKVVKNDIAAVKSEQSDVAIEVRKAVNDRTEILNRLSRIEGIDQGRRESEQRAERGAKQRDRERN